MAYSPTTWVDGVTTLGPTNLNKIETELARLKTNADLDAAAAIAYSKLNLASSVKASDMATSLADAPHGLELAYAEITSLVSVTATTEATANSVVSAGSVTFDGATRVCIEFFSPQTSIGTTNLNIILYDGASSIGFLDFTSGAGSRPLMLRRFLTPSNAAHTYSVRAYVDAGTGSVQAGAGVAGALVPTYVRITKA